MKPHVLAALLFATTFCWSQESNKISFDNLEVPNTPAFILLDEAPTTIQRPNSTRAFALDLLQDVTSNGFLGNMAIEVTPFWMIKHTNMTPEKFYGIKKSGDKNSSQNGFSKLRQASVSAAYMKSEDSVTNLSFGVRATLFEIKRKTNIEAYKKALTETQAFLNKTANYNEEYTEFCKVPNPKNYDDLTSYQTALTEFNSVCAEPPNKDNFKKNDESIDGEAYKKAKIKYQITCLCMDPERDNYGTQFEYEAAKTLFEKSREEYISSREKEDGFDLEAFDSRFQEIVNSKPLLAVDVAAAYNQRFYGNSFNDNSSGRIGVWSTLSFSAFLDAKEQHTDYLNIYGFARYLDDTYRGIVPGAADDRFNAFDIGIKGELEFQSLSIGYEYINRSGDMEGYRSVGTVRYQLLAGVFITGSFGNNFNEVDDLVTLFGIKWGLNNKLQNLIIPKE